MVNFDLFKITRSGEILSLKCWYSGKKGVVFFDLPGESFFRLPTRNLVQEKIIYAIVEAFISGQNREVKWIKLPGLPAYNKVILDLFEQAKKRTG
jgi:hypothetical protein